MHRVLCVLFLILIGSAPALADPPLPPKKTESLNDLKQKVEEEKKKQSEMKEEAIKLERDLTTIKKDLVKTAGDVQGNEKQLQKLEMQIVSLKQKKAELSEQFSADQKALSDLLIALERIRRLPPKTLIARPGAPRETAQAATALGAILPELNKRATALQEKLAVMNVTETELLQSQQEAKKAYATLKAEKEKMNALLSSRSRTYSQVKNDIQEQQKAVEIASREAANFQELIAKLDKKNKSLLNRPKPSNEDSDNPKPEIDEKTLNATLPTLGSAQLPVSGIVTVRYGEKDAIGASSQGISIQARTGALVVAPLGGVVRYAGPFKSYGNIILLEHKNNYHSLIAGLGRIDTVVGQSVDSGEPVGSLGSSSDSRPVLYYELRLNGQPVNPARKFTDLGI